MSWKDKMKEWGGGNISFLSEDAECVAFCVVDEPVLIEGKFKGQDTQRVGCPIVTTEGFSLLVVGKRVARRLSKHEKDFHKFAFELIRRGEPGDVKATYELGRLADVELEKELLTIAKQGVSDNDLQEAIAAAQECATG